MASARAELRRLPERALIERLRAVPECDAAARIEV